MKIAKQGNSISDIKESVINKAKQMADDDVQTNKEMGKMVQNYFITMIQ